jgi:hypothetical protein
MLDIKKILLIFLIVCQSLSTLAAESELWKGVTVEVKANQIIETKNIWKKSNDGFDYLSISLTNKGSNPIIIENIVLAP